MKSVMVHEFSKVPTIECPRSKFDRSFGYKTTFDSGYLVPFYVDEVLPGDTFDVDATIVARLSTPIVPIMDNVYLDTFFFFVPYRLIWSHFVNFMGEQDNPTDSTSYLTPIINAPSGGFTVGSLFDYFGLPTGISNIWTNAFAARAYNKIYNQWFRDENLQNSVADNMGDGPDNSTDYSLLRRGKRHDYFTSCLPWPQKGPGVELPLGTTAPILNDFSSGNSMLVKDTSGNAYTIGQNMYVAVSTATNTPLGIASSLPSGQLFPSVIDPNGTLVADLSNATAATINSLRQAFQLQKYYEKDARGGTRYIEKILSHFGVKSPDARLQRTEYLGGSSKKVDIIQVEQNSETTSTSPLGSLGAYGIVGSNNNGFVRSFTEHGIVIGMMNVRADLTYQQGIDRMFSRRTPVDFYWPTFAHLGEQAVYNKEIYAQGSSVVDANGNIVDDQVFGYQERYAEYRYKPSKITGKMRSTASGTLDVWHLSQNFTNLPTLSSQFIEDNPPIDRVVAVTTEPQFICDIYCKNVCIRPMPVYSVPGLVDHF